jgi:hypothetical protein
MLVCDLSGRWGLSALLGGAKKPRRYTGRCHYIFYVVCGRTFLTIGDEYKVPYSDTLLAEGFSAEGPRGNYYAVRNADAAAPATFLFYKTPGTAPASKRGEAEERRRDESDSLTQK